MTSKDILGTVSRIHSPANNKKNLTILQTIFSDMQNKTNITLAFLFLHAIFFLFNNVNNNLLVFCMGYGMLGVDCSYIILFVEFLKFVNM